MTDGNTKGIGGRRRLRLWGVAILVVGGVGVALTDNHTASGAVFASLLALGLIMVFAAERARGRARQAERRSISMDAGDRIVQWRFGEDEWRAWIDRFESTSPRPAPWAIAVAFVLPIGIGVWGWYQRVGEVSPVLVAGLVFAAAAVAVSTLRSSEENIRDVMLRGPAEVVIADDAYRIAQRTVRWGRRRRLGASVQLDRAEWVEDEAPHVVLVLFYAFGRPPRRHRIVVPVPADRSDEARALVSRLNGGSPADRATSRSS